MMDVYDAVASRRAVRRFTDKPVPKEVLERVLAAAARTPSGGNLQPWNTYVLTGASLEDVKQRTARRLAAGDRGDEREFEMYPPHLKSPYFDRQSAVSIYIGRRPGDSGMGPGLGGHEGGRQA